jgi:hypothetical protein
MMIPHATEKAARPDEAGMPLSIGRDAVGRRRMALHQPAFGKRHHRVAGDDEMVDHPHIHQAQRVLQVLCQQLIGPRGLGFPEGWLCATASAAALRASAP